MATWQLIAETNETAALNDKYKAELYVYSDDVITSRTHALLSDFKLTRGSASRRDKFGGISPTQITFSLRDYENRLLEGFSALGDADAKLILKRNGIAFFVGNLTITTTQKEIVFDNTAVAFRAFDGLSRLKEFRDWSDVIGTRIKIHQLMFKIFSALEFDLDIFIYADFYKGNTENGDEFPFESQYAYIEDYLAAKSDLSYWDVLDYLCKQFNLEIFQSHAVWHVRQNIAIHNVSDVAIDGITIVKVAGTTGAATKNKISLNNEVLFSELAEKPLGIKYKQYDKIIMQSDYGEKWKLATNSFWAYNDDKKNQVWLNPKFEKGNEGWETVSGSPTFKDGALIMENGDVVKQTSGEFQGGEKIKLTFQTDCSRMILSSSEILGHLNLPEANHDNPLFRVKYVGETNTYYFYSADTNSVATNGDVETGDTTGWSSDCTLSAQTSYVHGGSYALKSEFLAGDGEVLARNDFTLANNGGKVTASVWIKVASVTSRFVEAQLVLPGQKITQRVLLDSTDWEKITLEAENHSSGAAYFQLVYLDDDDEVFYIDDLEVLETTESGYSWQATEPSPDATFGISMLGVRKGLSNFLEIYTTNTFKIEEEIILPSEKGSVVVELFGGGTPSGNNYAGEYGAIHRVAAVEIVESETERTDAPNSFLLECFHREGNEKKIEVPFHDLDPYGIANFWYSVWSGELGYRYYRTTEWETPIGSKPLLEAVAWLLLNYHQSRDGYDVRLLPGTDFEFYELAEIDFSNSGTKKYYLPVYEETLLISDRKRFVLLRHELSSDVPSVFRYFLA